MSWAFVRFEGGDYVLGGGSFLGCTSGLTFPVVVRGLVKALMGVTSAMVLKCMDRATVSTSSLTGRCAFVLFYLCCNVTAKASILYTRC